MFGLPPSKHHRLHALFPSDIDDDELRQSIPLTSDEQQLAEVSGRSQTLHDKTLATPHTQCGLFLTTMYPLYSMDPSIVVAFLISLNHSLVLTNTFDKYIYLTVVIVKYQM